MAMQSTPFPSNVVSNNCISWTPFQLPFHQEHIHDPCQYYPMTSVNQKEKMEFVEEKWIKHYSSLHRILLVGEGDFSFSLSLARAFGSASKIVASSLDSYDELITKYKNAKSNLFRLKYKGASILHEVDVTKMKHYPGLDEQKFDRIIYNFPHAGFHRKEDNPVLIEMHKKLVSEFFRNASGMLEEKGEIHVSHKTTYPFNDWKIEDLASQYSLKLIECADFKIEDYPGYNNKKGAGSKCDEPFPLRECSTFKFMRCIAEAEKFPRVRKRKLDIEIPIQMEHRRFTNDMPLQTGLTLPTYVRNECMRIFGGYLNHVEEMFGRSGNDDVRGSLSDALRLGFQRYMREAHGRSLSRYIDILEELHHQSVLRSQRLKDRLAILDMQV